MDSLKAINKNWINSELTHHYTETVNDKLKVRLFTVIPSGTTINANSLAESLFDMLPDYMKTKAEIEAEIKREINNTITLGTTATDIDIRERSIGLVRTRTYRQAAKFFKKKSPETKSGKYGELLLFACAEALYDCKMIAHKITNLTNYHDEVKGGDGIFLGTYTLHDQNAKNAYFIGESKVWKVYSDARKDALDSINRFYDDDIQADFTGLEFFIAKKDISKFDDGTVDIDKIYNRLNPTSKEFKDQIAVHPILIMYDTPTYDKFMIKAADNQALSLLIEKEVSSKMNKTLKGIEDKVGEYSNLKKVYLDFILIPTNSVTSFNETMDNLI
jgi:hypothetical protein